jgi:hypothetical protein
MDRMEEIVRDARAKFFPVKLSDGIEARIVEPAKAMPFILGHLNQVFGDRGFGGEWLNIQERRQTRWQPLMERFSAVHTEFIFFYEGETPIGWFWGEMTDMVTFYMRNTALFEPYRGKGIYTAFCKHLMSFLEHIGYERVTSHHAGTNKAILIPKLSMGFDICGFEVHEQYGALVKLVYVFHPDRKGIYFDRYGHEGLDGAPLK